MDSDEDEVVPLDEDDEVPDEVERRTRRRSGKFTFCVERVLHPLGCSGVLHIACLGNGLGGFRMEESLLTT